MSHRAARWPAVASAVAVVLAVAGISAPAMARTAQSAAAASFATAGNGTREYIRDRTQEGQESARTRGKPICGAAVTGDAMLAVALHLRAQEMSLRDIAAVPDADISVIRGGEPETVAASSDRVLAIDSDQYAAGEGPCLEAAHRPGVVRVSVDQVAGRRGWPATCHHAQLAGADWAAYASRRHPT